MATETKKTRKKSRGEGGGIFSGVTTYLGEVRSEINKVSWPERDDVVRLTYIVLLTTIVSSIVLGTLSIFYGYFVEYGIEYPILFVILFIGAIGVAGYFFRNSNKKVGY